MSANLTAQVQPFEGKDTRIFDVVLCYLAPLCTKNISLFWQGEEVLPPGNTAAVMSLFLEDSFLQNLWMECFAKQNELYTSDDEHAVLLHRLQQIPQLHYPIEAIQSIPFSDSKFQILEAQTQHTTNQKQP
ncbi:unnamed protein product [Ilex paraguariensis]|uniref:Uncharacterized protein n=1 Tax=Ilex paraguariensis TaxID=185542 RepID=A0ABC8TUS8_9AQUA